MVKTKLLSIVAILVGYLSFSQEVFVASEVELPFFSVLKDLRDYNICLEENLGSKAIMVVRDDALIPLALADGFDVDSIIAIRFSPSITKLPFKEQKFIFLHEIAHHAGYFHEDKILAVKAYSGELPYYYEIALGQMAILLAQ